MKAVKAKIFSILNNDSTIRTLLGLPTITGTILPVHAYNKIRWSNLPTNPEYPCIVFKRITSSNELRFKDFKTAIREMYFEIYIFVSTPTPEVVDDIKDRITVLFQDTQALLCDSHIHYYLSEVIDDSGDVYLDEDNRYYSTLRIRFKLQKVCDMLSNI